MQNSLIKTLLLSLLILVFLGQGVANASMSCKLMMSSNNDHQNHMSNIDKMVDHSTMQHLPEHHEHLVSNISDSMQEAGNTSHQDCCDIECNCPATSCNTSSIFSDDQNVFAIRPGTGKISLYSNVLPEPLRNSLYRPPCIA